MSTPRRRRSDEGHPAGESREGAPLFGGGCVGLPQPFTLSASRQGTGRGPGESPERAQPSLVGAWGYPPTSFRSASHQGSRRMSLRPFRRSPVYIDRAHRANLSWRSGMTRSHFADDMAEATEAAECCEPDDVCEPSCCDGPCVTQEPQALTVELGRRR